MRTTRAMLAVACLIFIVAACDHKPAPLSQQEKQIVTELTANMKTRCVGRYLVDMPGDAWEWGRAKIQGVSIEAKAMTEDAWRQEVAQREIVLKTVEINYPKPYLYAVGQARGKDTYYFIYRDTVVDSPATRYIEAYKWNRGYRFLLKIETYDYLHPDQTDDPIVKRFDVKNDVPAKTALVFSLLDKLRGRTPDEIPTEPGVCFAGGFLPGPAGSSEDVHAQYGWDNMQDVSFDITTTPDIRESTTLLQRADGAEMHAELKAADGHLVRKGPVALTGMKAEEWLAESRMEGGGRGNLFSLFINETTSGPSTPYLSLDLTTGGQIELQGKLVKLENGSLTTGEAVALWDAVSRTLRMRPGAL